MGGKKTYKAEQRSIREKYSLELHPDSYKVYEVNQSVCWPQVGHIYEIKSRLCSKNNLVNFILFFGGVGFSKTL